jgi:alanyl-tRNA synthetase
MEVKMKSSQIRQKFLDYFQSKGHMVEPGASLIPHNDPTLLWINSGVAALKKYFDGSIRPNNPRIVNVQKSIRTNDIENVGKTARHHTFFEMLGNFSIGDYFKEEALQFAWEFLTSPEWMGFDPNRLYVSVHPLDEQAYRIWVDKIGFPENRILKSEENYWQIGDGPCGPNSEIYIDRGPQYDPQGLGEKLFFDEMENDRYVEVWNVVFSQYNGKEGVDRASYEELPQKNIDTGMGFERLCCVAQNVETNYDTDLFMPIIEEVSKKSLITYKEFPMGYRVIADHIRTVVFALSDGALFANEGRGYVLRRILRRAVRYGLKLGIQGLFLKDLVKIVVSNMSDFYPNLIDKQSLVEKLVEAEEKRFKNTLNDGEALLKNMIAHLEGHQLSGEQAFTLYDTYGFPLELTQEIAAEVKVDVDLEGFKEHMTLQQQRARDARTNVESMNTQSEAMLNFTEQSKFVGYDQTQTHSRIIGLFKEQSRVNSLQDEGFVVLDVTPFYAESGGQVSDTGHLIIDGVSCEVLEIIKGPHKQHFHKINVPFEITEGMEVIASIDQKRRTEIRKHHTLAHLLQSALKRTLGQHIAQAGSYVCDEYTRFDFTHFEKVTSEQLQEIESWINTQIGQDLSVSTNSMDIEAAKAAGATALFSEKYDKIVRVVSIGDVSMELCGGTHVERTSQLGFAKLISEESIGSGVRRILIKSSFAALKEYQHIESNLQSIGSLVNVVNMNQIEPKIIQILAQLSEKQGLIQEYEHKMMRDYATNLHHSSINIHDLAYILTWVEPQFASSLKSLSENLVHQHHQDVVVLVSSTEGKLSYVVHIGSKALASGMDANVIVKELNNFTQGRGGGKKDFAQGGTTNQIEPQSIIEHLKLHLNQR